MVNNQKKMSELFVWKYINHNQAQRSGYQSPCPMEQESQSIRIKKPSKHICCCSVKVSGNGKSASWD